MHWQGVFLILPLLIAVSCGGDAPQTPPPRPTVQRSPVPVESAPLLPAARRIDWSQSAGVFIGVQTFHTGSDLEVAYAADDAVDLAFLFTHELQLLEPRRVVLLLAGHPAKERSRAQMETLRSEATLIEDGRGSARVDADAIASALREQARNVGPDGILIVSFATHGLTHNDEHRLLTADASSGDPRGVVLAHLLDIVKAERVERLLLLIDACRREPGRGLPWAAASMWRPRMPEIESVQLQLPYAVLASTGPGGFAISDPALGNGCFTRAILDGLRGKASAQPAGFVTLSNLANYVSDRVRELSNQLQQPESRIGGLERLCLVQCGAPEKFGEIVDPKRGDHVGPSGVVRVRIDQPEIFATVVVCSVSNNVCFNQNPGAVPIETHAGETIELTVRYGGPAGRYTVHTALTVDPHFLRNERDWEFVPRSEAVNGRVQWCGPVEVTFKRKRKGGTTR